MMRSVCFVNSTHKWGGVKSWTLEVGQRLMQEGIQCHVLARKGPFIEAAAALGMQTEAVAFGIDYSPRLLAWMMRYFRRKAIDLVVANVGKDLRTGGIAARMLHIPVVHRVGLDGDMKNKLDVRLNYHCIRPILLVPCKQIKEGLVSRLPFLKAEKIVVAHTVKSPAPVSPGTVCRPLNIVVTSQLNADKGHGTLLQSLGLVLDKGLDFRLHVVGIGSEEAVLKKQARDLGLEKRIVWHGFQTDVRSLVGQCDIFVLPSFSEGFPNSLLEAMAEGLICISRDVGGVREIWFDTETPLLPASAGPREFAAALIPVLESADQDVLERKKKLYRRYYHWVKQKERETSWSDVFRYCLDLYTGKEAGCGGRS